MDRRALTRGGFAALALVAVYALLGGDIDLGSDDKGTSTTTSTAVTTTAEAPPGFSEEETTGIATTLAAIDTGGELPYDQDGGTFQNREGRLPSQPQGYYREYTVVTPGSDDRGARRLVIGESGETFYTRDHYDSFVEIDPEEFR
jgi:ribonuclease T1